MGESPLIKYMVARCATHFPIAYETTPVPGQGFEIAPLIHSGNQATKDRGLMRGQFPGAGFSGTSTRLQWIAHQDPVGHTRSFGGACTRPQRCGWGCGRGLCARASVFLGNPGEFSSPPQNPGGHLPDSDGIVRGCTNHDRRRGGI